MNLHNLFYWLRTVLFCCFLFLCSGFVFSQESPASSLDYIRYSFFGSYKALEAKPKGAGPFPVVIYSYDEFYDWSGKELAEKVGYKLEEIARFFADRGYVCVIPVQRYRRVHAILGVLPYLKKKPYIKANQVHLVGMSEGGFMSMVAAQQAGQFASMTLVAPIEIYDKGYLSRSFFLHRARSNPKMPVFFIFVHDVAWRIQSQRYVHKMLDSLYDNVIMHVYYREKRWFWDIGRYGMAIHQFMTRQYTELNESSYTR